MAGLPYPCCSELFLGPFSFILAEVLPPLSLGSEQAIGIKVHLLPRSSPCPSCGSRRKGIEKYNMERETWKMWAQQSVSVSDKAERITKLVS